MIEHNFKIGDEVKVCDSSRWKKRIMNTIGVIVVKDENRIYVEWETKGCVICGVENPCNYPQNIQWHSSHDIEHVVKVGEQLLFSFMTPQAYKRCETTQKGI